MNDPDGKEQRLMNHMEEQMGEVGEALERSNRLLESMPVAFGLRAEGVAKAQSEALVLLVKNLLVLVNETDAEDDTVALCRELCLTAEFFNKILQSEKFENIPF